MKKTFSLSLAALVALGLVGCSSNTDKPSSTASSAATTEATTETSAETKDAPIETAHYDVVKRDGKITLDGVLDEEVWDTVLPISGSFHYPWEAVEAPSTEYKGYHDGENFYFSFVVKDPQVLVEKEWNDDERSTVDNEDRVEMFFTGGEIDKERDGKLQPYYNIEIDAKGRVHDYSMVYYRDQMDSTWDFEGLEAAGQQTDDGYVVEALIPISALKDLKLLGDNNVMRTGVYRAEFSKPEGAEEIDMHWISWVDPKTEEPDYHVDSSFGEFRFLQ